MTQQKYVKLISEHQIQVAPRNYHLEDGTIIFNFNINETIMLQYGFKPLIQVERPVTDRVYTITYEETVSNIQEVLTYTETEEAHLSRHKTYKHNENNEKAYAFEKVGVFPYTAESIQTGEQVEVHIEFNVDNLSKFQAKLKAFEKQLYPEGKTTWLSQENIPIYITEEDCQNILLLIEQYDSYMWETVYLNYETQIEACTTVEEVEAIVIEYDVPDRI